MQIDEARAKHAVQQAFQKIVKPADFDAAIVEEFGRQASAERERARDFPAQQCWI